LLFDEKEREKENISESEKRKEEVRVTYCNEIICFVQVEKDGDEV
jgi:hypothetical protein